MKESESLTKKLDFESSYNYNYIPGEATNWPDYLPAIRIAYNSKVNSNTGASPNLLFFGRESLHPIQLHLPQLPLAVTPAEHLLHLRARVEMVMAQMHQA